MRPLTAAIVTGVAVMALTVAARADKVDFTAQLDSEPDDAAAARDAKGAASLSLDTATGAASWRIEYSGLSRPAAGVGCGEISAPAGPVIWRTDHLASPVSGVQTLTAPQAASLAAGRWVCVVDTDDVDIGGTLKPAR